MKKGLAVISVIMLCNGCASWMDYHDLQSRHDHLLDEKERLETEQTDLRAIVLETRRSYQVASQSMGLLQAQIEQTTQTTRSAREELAKTKAMAESHAVELRSQGQRVTQLGTQFDQLMGQVSMMSDRNQALTDRVDQLLTVTKRLSTRIQDPASPAAAKSVSAKPSSKEKSEAARSEKADKRAVETAAQSSDKADSTRNGAKASVAGLRSDEKPSEEKSTHAPVSAASAGGVTPVGSGISGVSPMVSAPTPVQSSLPVAASDAGAAKIVDMTGSAQSVPPSPVASVDASPAKPQITRSDLTPVPVSRFEQFKALASRWLPGAAKSTSSGAPVAPVSPSASETSPAPGSQKLLTISEHPGVPAPDAVVTVPVVPPAAR